MSSSHKGGMDGIDADKIAKITLETAKHSSFTQHQIKLDRAVDRRISRLRDAQAHVLPTDRQAARAAVSKRITELEGSRRLDRVCCVIDFDMFYAAVAIRDRPELAEKPLAVGGALVLTANYYVRLPQSVAQTLSH